MLDLTNLSINQNVKKCFVFDLDGTIIFEGQPLSPFYYKLLNKIKAHGHQIVFATGRVKRNAFAMLPLEFHDHLMTLISGALSMETRLVLFEQHIPKIQVQEILELLLNSNYDFVLDSNHKYYHPLKNHQIYQYEETMGGNYREHKLENLLTEELYKILIFEQGQNRNLFEEYAAVNGLSFKYHSYDKCFDLVAGGVSKFHALSKYLDYDNQNIFAFGNDYNDKEMLENFGNGILIGDNLTLNINPKLNIGYGEQMERQLTWLIEQLI